MATIQARTAPGTLVLDPNLPAHVALRRSLPRWRAVACSELIGRDVTAGARLCVADWRIFGAVPYLRETLMQNRGRTIALVGLSDEPCDDGALAMLRRFAGEVVALVSAAQPSWTSRLLVPVSTVGPAGVADAIVEACRRPAADLGSVDVHLREAIQYMQRGDDDGAFQASARALAMAPDQPGIIADVARLLARMGRSADGEQLCRTFLLQRPDSAPVQAALGELAPLRS
jgi:hypothetical protein